MILDIVENFRTPEFSWNASQYFTIILYLTWRNPPNLQLPSPGSPMVSRRVSRVSWWMAVAISSSNKPSIVTKPLCATRDTSPAKDPKGSEKRRPGRCIRQLRSGQQVQGHPNHPLTVQNLMVIFVAGFLQQIRYDKINMKHVLNIFHYISLYFGHFNALLLVLRGSDCLLSPTSANADQLRLSHGSWLQQKQRTTRNLFITYINYKIL